MSININDRLVRNLSVTAFPQFKKTMRILFFFVASIIVGTLYAEESINRKSLVGRHAIVSKDALMQIPLGDGEFCVTVDGTGLQTTGGNIMSHWAWHSSPLPERFEQSDVPSTGTFQQGRCKGRDTALPTGFEPLRKWMFDNPHGANLGRIRLVRPDGTEIKAEEIKDVRRKLDLYSGVHVTHYKLENETVAVTACVDPRENRVVFEIVSPLLAKGKIGVLLDFPYPNEKRGNWVGDFELPDRHKTTFNRKGSSTVIAREADDLVYTVRGDCGRETRIETDADRHSAQLFAEGKDRLVVGLTFGNAEVMKKNADADRLFQAALSNSKKMWNDYWSSGGAIDLSKSSDPRWKELERRIVLSQYLVRCNSAGSWPPAECGLLTSDPWRRQFHMEMIWWHLAHYALWDRFELAEEALQCYEKHKPVAKRLAEQLGYQGYKWGKSVGPNGRTAPWVGNQILLWKQPHPIFFAELEYRLRPKRETLEKWADIIEGTAENMVDYATRDEKGVYHLDPAMPPSEIGDTKDDIFDLAYWRWGLETANQWRLRMDLPRNTHWDEVRNNLPPMPTLNIPNDGVVFSLSAEWHDTYRNRHRGHPDLIGIFGMLPAMKEVDFETARRTVAKVARDWQWERCWGWDYPWIAMAAARTGQPELAVDMLLHQSKPNHYDKRGVNTGGPCPYLPGNGGLLYTVAMMAAGWDGDSKEDAPGFPKNGKWIIRHEGLKKAP